MRDPGLEAGDASTVEGLKRRRYGYPVRDRRGERYGRLVALRRAPNLGKGTAAWVCKCDCGSELVVSAVALQATQRGAKTGTRSCGCSRATGPGSRPYARARKIPGKAARRTVLQRYKDRARFRDLPFSLTDEQFDRLTSSSCQYCGTPPSAVARAGKTRDPADTFTYTGIDRIDSSKGYTVDNVVSCCGPCNRAKAAMPEERFLAWIQQLVQHWAVLLEPNTGVPA